MSAIFGRAVELIVRAPSQREREGERKSRIFNFKGHGFMHTVGAYQGGERKGREVRVDLNDCASPPPPPGEACGES